MEMCSFVATECGINNTNRLLSFLVMRFLIDPKKRRAESMWRLLLVISKPARSWQVWKKRYAQHRGNELQSEAFS